MLLISAWLFAIWRLSAMLVNEAGPFEVFERLRYKARDTMLGALLECVWCTSVWVSALLLILAEYAPGRYAIYVLAGSAGAIIIHVVVERIKSGD